MIKTRGTLKSFPVETVISPMAREGGEKKDIIIFSGNCHIRRGPTSLTNMIERI